MREVRDGIATLLDAMRADPRCLETVCLAVITFGAVARQVVPLTSVDHFSMPSLRLGTGTPLGSALNLLSNAIDTQVQRSTNLEIKGDWRPLCFIITDGLPTDEWRSAARAFRARVDSGSISAVALACGPDVEVAALKEVTPTVLQGGFDSTSIRTFFRWVTNSVRAASLGVGAVGAEKFLAPPKELDNAVNLKIHDSSHPDLYLVSRCQKKRLPYVMKHRWNGRVYGSTENVPLEDLEVSTIAGTTVQSGEVEPSACPHCTNAIWASCVCSRLFCCPTNHGRFTCPWCEGTNDFSPGNFSITGSGG